MNDKGRYVNPYTPTVGDKVEAVGYWRSGQNGHYGGDRKIVGEIRKINLDGSVEIEFTDGGAQRIKRHSGDFGVLR